MNSTFPAVKTCRRVAWSLVLVLVLVIALLPARAADAWKPVPGNIMTRWAKDVSPKDPHPEYPRPTMVREEWQNLNGLWDYAIVPTNAPKPAKFDGKILVPFPVESALSGVKKVVGAKNRLWYQRTFTTPRKWRGQRVLLNFGAVDWEAVVHVNGKEVGSHRGGYDGFSFDITDALKPKGEQELAVSVWDPSDDGPQPRGKQVKKGEGIWYTPTTGIWQTPWLEPVNETHIRSLRITPNVDDSTVAIDASSAKGGYTVEATVRDGSTRISSASASAGQRITLPIKNPKPWTPEKPHLYHLEVKLKHGWRTGDSVESYFGMRKMALAKDDQGLLRMQLNNQTLFQYGPLDQGFWPDGLYTAPTDEALRWDIEMTKKLGFNMARKHVKVEPERWYYWCDKLGLLVWQDMPSGDKSARWQGPSGFDGEEMKRAPESAAIYEREWKAIIDARYNHPSIVTWVPFNEGWGQFDTVRILNWTKQYDPTRLVDGASGGNHFLAGDILDHHQYPGPGAPKRVTDRAMVLGEFGGLGLPMKGHTWQEEKNWGYRSFTNSEGLTEAFVRLTRKLHPMIRDHGLSAAIYTQTTDVEVEVNGLFTYDRQVLKMDETKIAAANRKLYGPPPLAPRITVLSPTSKAAPMEWAYTTDKPTTNWAKPDFDDSEWKRGPGGFGTRITPNSVVRTEWNTTNIGIRRAFEAPVGFKAHELQLNIFHDEDARVYLNGQLIADLKGFISNYEIIPLDHRASQALQPGRNVLAVSCKQTRGGQYIDAGLEDADDSAPASASATAPPPGSTGRAADNQTQSAALYAGDVIKANTKEAVTVPLPKAKRDGLYAQNREPLTPAPFMKLPIGAIQPRGWLRHQLDLEAQGMVGRLPEISPWLNFSKSSWAAADGSGNYGWEEMPYWLKGFGDLAYVLKDEKLLAEAKKWIEAILQTQREDGYFGPRMLLTSLKGQPDLWPHMLVNNILQSWFEYSSDERVIRFLLKYHRWLNAQPDSTFSAGYWPRLRWGDNIETCHWLYNRTGEKLLLDLAGRIHRNMGAWRDGIVNWHNVNLAQGFREPAVFFTQSGAARDLAQAEANYRELMGTYGQFAGGGFAGDENCRPGFIDPRQGFETCGMVEFMHSFEMLAKISGDTRWPDRTEDIAFNSLPAALTPDWKGLHYLTCANQIQLDRHNKAPALQNGGTMVSYSPFEVYRCCQHNVSHGWPYYAQELWLATADKGLAASLYAASEVAAKVGDGTQIKFVEETDYPFGDTITLKLSTPKAVKFPLHLRIPHWATGASVAVNGKTARVTAKASSFAIVDRQWQDGDTVTLTLPMKVRTRTWTKNQNSASVDYGPLTFSLKIGERWEKYGDRSADWPEQEVFPTAPWNYGLEFDARNPEKSFAVVKKAGPVAQNPFTHDTAPIELRAKARRILAWKADRLNLVGKLQPSPVKSSEPVETVSLIPMGAARLRITSFPVIGNGSGAREWIAPVTPPIAASHNSSDSVEAMIDGIEPKNSNDHSIPRFTWWDHRGTEEWVEWGFPKAKEVSEVALYWFDDTGRGQCRVPQSWRVLYRSGERWLPVEGASAFGTAQDRYNRVTFKPVSAEGLRLEVQLQPNVSGGILEWKAK